MYKPGETVIVTQDDVNRVGVVLDEFKVNKQTVYDVLLETRSAMCMIGTAPKSSTRINRTLTTRLCGDPATAAVTSTIPYKAMLEAEAFPFTKS